MATKQRSCWIWLEDRLYSFCVECLIIFLTIINVLVMATEFLIDLQIIRAPVVHNVYDDRPVGYVDTINNTHDTVSDDDVNGTSHVEGSTSPSDMGRGEGYNDDGALPVVNLLCHYFSLAVASLFLLEIFLKMVTKNKEFFKDRWQVFDAVVVVAVFVMEVVFTVMDMGSIYAEAATFIIILRLWRIPRVCNMKVEESVQHSEGEIYRYDEARHKEDGDYKYLQQKLDKQEKEIKRLESMLRRYQQENHIDSNRNNTDHMPAIEETQLQYDKYAEEKSTTIIETATKEAADFRYNSTGEQRKNGHIPSHLADRRGSHDHTMYSEGEVESHLHGGGADSESSMSLDGGRSTPHEIVVDLEGSPGPGEGNYMETKDGVLLIKDDKDDTDAMTYAYTNQSFETDVSLDDRNWQVLAEIDGTKTYRSAEGIPMTSL